jgi:peroxiredoxin
VKAIASLADALAEILIMDAPLKERLAAYVEAQRVLNSPFAEAYDQLVARLKSAGVGKNAPKIGELMPPFLLPDHTGTLVKLEDLTRAGRTILSFNRGHWCPFCKIELRSLIEADLAFATHEARIVSIMPELQTMTARLMHELNNKLRVLSDIDNGFALSLGLVFWVGEKIIELMKARGLDLQKFQGNDGWFLPVPATFVLNRDGRIIARSVNPDFRTRMAIDEIVHALARSARD